MGIPSYCSWLVSRKTLFCSIDLTSILAGSFLYFWTWIIGLHFSPVVKRWRDIYKWRRNCSRDYAMTDNPQLVLQPPRYSTKKSRGSHTPEVKPPDRFCGEEEPQKCSSCKRLQPSVVVISNPETIFTQQAQRWREQQSNGLLCMYICVCMVLMGFSPSNWVNILHTYAEHFRDHHHHRPRFVYGIFLYATFILYYLSRNIIM